MNENDTFEMINEDGTSETFSFLATFEYDGDLYMCVQPHNVEDIDVVNEDHDELEEEEVPVMFFHCHFGNEDDPEDEDVYTVVTDEELLDKLFDKFLSELEEGEDEEEDDGEEGDA